MGAKGSLLVASPRAQSAQEVLPKKKSRGKSCVLINKKFKNWPSKQKPPKFSILNSQTANGGEGRTSETSAAAGGQSPCGASGASWGHLRTPLSLPLRIKHQKVVLVADKRASHRA